MEIDKTNIAPTNHRGGGQNRQIKGEIAATLTIA
jgi:hypothetical protein